MEVVGEVGLNWKGLRDELGVEVLLWSVAHDDAFGDVVGDCQTLDLEEVGERKLLVSSFLGAVSLRVLDDHLACL